MVLMSAELDDASVLGALPKDWYAAKITAVEVAASKATAAPMLNVTLTVQSGPFANKRVFPPDHVMLGGTTEKGDKQDLRRLCDYINATGIEWKCMGCGTSGARRKFIKDDRAQKYLCPDCRKPAGFAYDTDHFLNKDVKVLLNQEKGFNSDEMVNSVSRITELT